MDSSDLEPIQKTLNSLDAIEKSLTPLLAIQTQNRVKLENMKLGPVPEEERVDLKQVAEVNAAIALAIKTLFYVKLRLEGVQVTSSHPVRKGLNRVRQTMKRLRAMHTVVPGGEGKKVIGEKRRGEKKVEEERKEEEEGKDIKKMKKKKNR